MHKSEDDRNPENDLSTPIGRASSSLDERVRPEEASSSTSPSAPRAMFAPGAILSARFRIVRLLGRGGMGEVYEAEDLELKEKVALKTLLPNIATDEHSLERFRREVHLARKVTHPNVCRIFEVFRDTPAGSPAGSAPAPVMFMTMELLPGPTLGQFLRLAPQTAAEGGQTGAPGARRLTPAEALPLVIQMAAALEAAHQAGIVHRDFKPGNVVLAPRPGKPEPRVVVTDFGLSRLALSEGMAAPTFTEAGGMVGTPSYMSPEQVQGGEITAATDIYALGIVMYEMMTGALPFAGSTVAGTLFKRLQEKPAPPKSLVPSLDAKWNAVILRCLEREPGDRFPSAAEVVEALRDDSIALRRYTRKQQKRLKQALGMASAAILLLSGAYTAYRRWPRGGGGTGTQGSVAVVRFQNLSANAGKDWIGSSLEDAVTRDLALSEKLRVTPSADITRMRQELEVQPASRLDDKKMEQIRTNLGAESLVLGEYELSGEQKDAQVRVTLHLQNPGQPSTQTPIVETGRESDLFGLSDRIAQALRARLGVGGISEASRAQLRASLPANEDAGRAYFQGLDKLRQFDPLGARDFLEEAARASPDSPLVHSALADVWAILGYDDRALAEAKRAQETSQRLSRPQQIEIECRALELARMDWDKALLSCRSVWELRKGLDDGLRLAEVQYAAQHLPDSLATLALLRKQLPDGEREDPRIDIAEAVSREALTQYPQMEAAAQSAKEKAAARGTRLFEATALLWDCAAKQNLDKLQQAGESCNTANSIYYAVGDKIGQARALTSLAHVLSKLNQPAEATKKYEEALRLATSVGSMRDRCDAAMNYGAALYDRRDTAGAARKYEESRKIGEESGYRACQARAVENLGLIARDAGQFDRAGKHFKEAARTYGELQMGADLARVESNTGTLLWRRGELAAARASLENAAKRRRALGLRDGLALTLSSLGDVLLALDQVEPALVVYQEAWDIQTQLQEENDAAVTGISIAQALVVKGSTADAEAQARKGAAWFYGKKDRDNEAFARTVLVDSLLAQHRDADAWREAQTLQALLSPTVEEETWLAARIAVSRALATQKSSPRALAELRAIAAEAKKRSFLMQELSANLALVEAEKLQGIQPNQSTLVALVENTKTRGYLLLARKASALLAPQ